MSNPLPSLNRKLALKDHLGFIAEFAAHLREAQSQPGTSAEERGRYARWVEHAGALDTAMRNRASALAKPVAPDDLSDLPPELLEQLHVRRVDPLESQIVAVLRNQGGTADLDQILIGLYRQFQNVQKRRVLQNKIWRLVRKGRIVTAKNKRNHFSLPSPTRQTKQRQKK